MDKVLEFAGNHTLLVAALVASLLLLLFTEIRRKAGAVLSVASTDAVRLINNDAAVIDLRSVDAFGRGHIVNARNVPLDELDAKIDKLGDMKSKTLLAVCDAGMSCGKAVEKLRNAGFENTFGLKGGMNGWIAEGMPVVTGKKTVTARKSKGKKNVPA